MIFAPIALLYQVAASSRNNRTICKQDNIMIYLFHQELIDGDSNCH